MTRKLRLASGLVLFVFLASHLLNHTLGLHSLRAMEGGLNLFSAVWRSPPGTFLLLAAFLVHGVLAFHALYRRRRLSMPPGEGAQLLLGLLIPPLLALHVLGTRVADEVLAEESDYLHVLAIYLPLAPLQGLRLVTVLLVAWIHGVLGLHFWLRLKPWYPRLAPWLGAGALLLPTLALAGFWTGGQEVGRLLADPAWAAEREALIARIQAPEKLAFLGWAEPAVFAVFFSALAATLAARPLRRWWEHRLGRVEITYPGGRRVVVPKGHSILEASRGAGIPHASLCGGRGRCSTCRVRVAEGLERLPPPSEEERKVLARVAAAPNVRLACQTRPEEDLSVTPLLPPNVTPRDARPRPDYSHGLERESVILFADLRNFTSLSEQKLPYDVVFLLNRYFRAMGTAVEEAGGRVDKFIGDGVMALFAVDTPVEQGCRQAIAAARAMGSRLAEINSALKDDLPSPLKLGIGIHVGPVILGEMGYNSATSLTAIGDTVNTASRLESLTKELGVPLVLSAEVAARAGLDLPEAEPRQVALRGRGQTLAVLAVAELGSLPE